MSQIQIEVLVSKITQPEGKKFQVLELTFKNLSFQGKTDTKKINGYYEKAAFAALQDAPMGAVFTVDRKKEGEYWQWIGATQGGAAPVGKSSQTSGSGSSAGNSTGRTFVADDVKQVMIVRQSSLSTAAKALEGKEPNAGSLISFAKELEAYVLGTDAKKEETAEAVKPAKAKTELPDEFDDDIPF